MPESLSETEKIFGLSKVWKEADKNFVFFDQVPNLNWDQLYQEYIPKVLETKSTYDYYKKLQEFYSNLNDGHTRVIVPWQLRRIHEVKPALKTHLVGNSIFISEVLNDTIRKNGITEGMEILEINGDNVHDYATKYVRPYMFYSTEQDLMVQIYDHHLLRGHINEDILLKMKNGITFTISRKLKSEEKETKAYEFKILKNSIGYLKLNRFWGENLNQKFDSILPEILKTKSLIIDISDNSGGNSNYAHYIVKHLVDKSFESSRWKTKMYMPAYASWNYTEQWQENKGSIIKPVSKEKRYLKALVILISEKTYSAGEDFVSSFISTNRGKIIGRPTAGTTGNPIGFAIPGMGGFQVCTKKDYLPSGKEFVGYGIEPEIIVPNEKGKNHLLKAAINFLNKQ